MLQPVFQQGRQDHSIGKRTAFEQMAEPLSSEQKWTLDPYLMSYTQNNSQRWIKRLKFKNQNNYETNICIYVILLFIPRVPMQ